jgi:hypothetical protein
MVVQLVMLITRSANNHLSGTVRAADSADGREFSGMLELMRVFEDLVPVDPCADAPGVPWMCRRNPRSPADG